MLKSKTPISYYGGKQMLASKIIKLIPKHKLYVEPFFGGGAVFFAKEKSEVEIINDLNLNVINFLQVCKNKALFSSLKYKVRNSHYSRHTYEKSKLIIKNAKLFNAIDRAFCFWFNINFSFNNALNGGFRHSKNAKEQKKINSKKLAFNSWIHKRLNSVEIEHLNALTVIKRRDCIDAFFYLDPPYIGANQGHYAGYKSQDFNNLLELLENIKAKFLLSCYMTNELKKYIKKNNWYLKKKETHLHSSRVKNRKKIECFVANYDLGGVYET